MSMYGDKDKYTEQITKYTKEKQEFQLGIKIIDDEQDTLQTNIDNFVKASQAERTELKDSIVSKRADRKTLKEKSLKMFNKQQFRCL